MSDQLKDVGAVIGYRPELKYEKQLKGVLTEGNHVDNYIAPGYSSSVQAFIENSPSKVLEQIEDSKQRIDSAIKRMADLFRQESHEQYQNIDLFISGLKEDNSYANEFLSYHYNKIEGSQIPEIIDLLIKEEERLHVLSSTLKKLYYGNSNLSTSAAEKIDQDYVSLITSKEYNGEREGINYLTISSDTKLNKTIASYLGNLNTAVIDLESSLYQTSSGTITGNKMISDTITHMFNTATNDLTDKKEIYYHQQEIATMEKTLYNYYGKRRELKDFYNAVYLLNDEFLSNKLNAFSDGLNNAITNVDRTIFGSAAYLSLIYPIEVEKQHLRDVYHTINYKP